MCQIDELLRGSFFLAPFVVRCELEHCKAECFVQLPTSTAPTVRWVVVFDPGSGNLAVEFHWLRSSSTQMIVLQPANGFACQTLLHTLRPRVFDASEAFADRCVLRADFGRSLCTWCFAYGHTPTYVSGTGWHAVVHEGADGGRQTRPTDSSPTQICGRIPLDPGTLETAIAGSKK